MDQFNSLGGQGLMWFWFAILALMYLAIGIVVGEVCWAVWHSERRDAIWGFAAWFCFPIYRWRDAVGVEGYRFPLPFDPIVFCSRRYKALFADASSAEGAWNWEVVYVSISTVFWPLKLFNLAVVTLIFTGKAVLWLAIKLNDKSYSEMRQRESRRS